MSQPFRMESFARDDKNLKNWTAAVKMQSGFFSSYMCLLLIVCTTKVFY